MISLSRHSDIMAQRHKDCYNNGTMTTEMTQILLDGMRREGWPALAAKHSADKGGWTRGGITARNWGDWRLLGRDATPEELNAITAPQALDFYFQRYVVLPKFDLVTDKRLQALLVDWAFTSWSDDPIKALQTSLARQGMLPGAIDGRLGPKTFIALSRANVKQTFNNVLAARIAFYLWLAFDAQTRQFLRDHPTTQLHNARGWVNRCLEFLR